MNKPIIELKVSDHSRQFKDCIYVYPVVSRRSQGVSLGINLNINNACNWRCVYCQVEGLIRDKPERMDLVRLEYEFDIMLKWIIEGDFIEKYALAPLNRFNDICLAGNGEPTLSKDFVAVLELIAKLRNKYKIGKEVKTLLITNGSELHQPEIQEGIKILAQNHGEVWFKIDRATSEGISKVNQVNLHLDKIIDKLMIAGELCPTWIQSCWFKVNDIDPANAEIDAFVALMARIKDKIKLCGVLLYSTARNPALPEGQGISQVSEQFLDDLAAKIRALGIVVKSYV